MIKLSNRLLQIASLVETKNVFDIGCDHGYLSIYLSNNHNVTATDISDSSIKKTELNKKKYDSAINIIKTNGIENLNIKKNDTIIISGMGTNTILDILNNNNISNNLIIQSNNNLNILRKSIINKGYYIKKEIVIEENSKFCVIIYFKKGKKKYSFKDYILGLSDNLLYKNYIKNIYYKAYNNIPNKYIIKKLKYKILLKKIS